LLDQVESIDSGFKVSLLTKTGAPSYVINQAIMKETEPLVQFVKVSSLYCSALVKADDRDSEGTQSLKNLSTLV
jgi:hypothetical protein